ncbi:ss-1,4-galactosyltransferase [Lacticaseibacillus paracasei subsp. paracasei Lpp221]|uniref:glycosyltransferase family 2 protein n=1 Tax=Lacticaseibacillus paracasei TaxID=1597 RepID=UPI000343AB3B|nr:glycosyltransferase family 2 protein [Lacticaseibacillus paracasei]EPC80434.1 ss-1,4-galactosyltransferase [Lacticaseibacillus paracasei subsp. paracasei Lpp221]
MLSVIVPVYNVETYLRSCVRSILASSYQNLDLILIDDGSSDKSGEICDNFTTIDSRVRTFHTENQGQSAARNLGLRNSHGQCLTFVDADDVVSPDYFDRMLSFMKQTDADIISAPFAQHSDRVQDAVVPVESFICDVMAGDLGTVVWNKIFTKNLLFEVEFPTNSIHEEIDFNRQYLKKVHTAAVISNSGYQYTQDRSGNTNSSFDPSRIETYRQIDKFIDEYKKLFSRKVVCALELFGAIHFYSMMNLAQQHSAPKNIVDAIAAQFRRYYWLSFRDGALRLHPKSMLKMAFHHSQRRN